MHLVKDSTAVLQIRQLGALSSLQSLPEFGNEHLGIRPSGAMDQFAFGWGNRLLGNAADCPALELPWTGGRFACLRDCTICLTGAEMSLAVDAMSLPVWKAHQVMAGQEITLQPEAWGVYGYLAVQGGLWKHDSDVFFGGEGDDQRPPAVIDDEAIARYYAKQSQPVPIRVLPGSDFALMQTDLTRHFLTFPLVLTQNCNRQGFELSSEGNVKQHWLDTMPEKISGFTPVGAIQLPRSGKPIALMRDRQTTGGLPKIFQIIAADINRLAQLRPGTKVQFQMVDIETAVRLENLMAFG